MHRSWAAYVAGGLLALAREDGAAAALLSAQPKGAAPTPQRLSVAVLVASDVPPGAGVSSSAALEVAALTAIAAALELDVPHCRIALLCQQVHPPPTPK